jgi:lycopene cyclase domain-containing protein
MPVYLYLILFTLSFPLVLSFDKNVQFVKKWKYFFPAAVLPIIVFLVWDYLFTLWGVWGFSAEYLLGYYFLNLPVEEISFFIVVPFACIFIYECLNYYIKIDILKPYETLISITLLTLFFSVGILNIDKLYTSVNFISAGFFLAITYFIIKPKYLGRFYFSYLVVLIPFVLVNGILTYLPVVWYNDAENLGIRLVSIPVEDLVYNFSKLLSYTVMYEWLKQRDKSQLEF